MKSEHKHGGTASNTMECWSTFIGCTVRGVVRNASPEGSKTFVFDCGWGLTVFHTGTFWVESPEDVRRMVDRVKDDLTARTNELAEISRLAGG